MPLALHAKKKQRLMKALLTGVHLRALLRKDLSICQGGIMNLSEIINLELPRKFSPLHSQFEIEFDPDSKTIWSWLNPLGIPCFTPALLSGIRAHDSMLEANNGFITHDGALHKANYYVVGSRVAGIFNFGGDLALFLMLIRSGERDALARYASLCIDNIYPRIKNYFCPTLTTISLIQGDALGGGFETALASDILIAEESAQMGLPEILFNLFPGRGAYSLLARRIGTRQAEQLITSGKIHSARKMHEMGVVDVLVPDGHGKKAVEDWICANQRRRNGFQAVMGARNCVDPIERNELDKITDLWVDAAMRLEERDLKMISRIVRSQTRRMDNNTPIADGATVAA